VKKILLFILLAISGWAVSAQDSARHLRPKTNPKQEKRDRINSLIKQEEEGNLAFRKQTIFGLQLRTNGYGGFVELGRRRSPRFANTYSLEITEIKSNKEQKVGGAQSFFGGSFIYGKINNFYQAKLGFGQQYIFGQKGNKNGVAVIGSLQAGIDLGLLKPYYLQVQDSTGTQKNISYFQDSATFINGPIYGSGGFTKGLGEIKLKPGLYVKGALRFDFGKFNETVSAIEIGLSVEAFSGKVQIMDYNPGKQLFYQGHIAFVFGRRK
jgi:hypothetical protein